MSVWRSCASVTCGKRGSGQISRRSGKASQHPHTPRCSTHLPAVVALPCRVRQRGVRDLGVLVQEHPQLQAGAGAAKQRQEVGTLAGMRHGRGRLDEVLRVARAPQQPHLARADAQVVLIELVRDVPAHGAKLLALLQVEGHEGGGKRGLAPGCARHTMFALQCAPPLRPLNPGTNTNLYNGVEKGQAKQHALERRVLDTAVEELGVGERV